MIGEVPKANVTIYLPADVLYRCRSAAASERRTLSNYLSGLLERAHPAEGHMADPEAPVTTTAAKQAQHRANLAARAARMADRAAKHK